MNILLQTIRAITTKSALIAALIGLIASIVFLWYANSHSSKETVEAFATIIIGLGAYMFCEMAVISSEIRQNNEKLNAIDHKLVNIRDRFSVDNLLIHNLLRTSKLDPVLADVVMKYIISSIEALGVHEVHNKVNFRNKSATLSSFEDLWIKLIELQKKSGKKHPIQLFITHADGTEIYSKRSEPLTLRLFALQEDFINEGGRISRILIDNYGHIDDAKLKEYIQTMGIMENIGIKCAFINLGNVMNEGIKQLNHDILVVIPLGYSLEWSRGGGGVLQQSFLSKEKTDFDNQLITWNALVRELGLYNYALDTDNAEYVKKFNLARQAFLATDGYGTAVRHSPTSDTRPFPSDKGGQPTLE